MTKTKIKLEMYPDLFLAAIDNQVTTLNCFNVTPKVLIINYNDWQRVLSIIKDLKGTSYLDGWTNHKFYNGMRLRRSEDIQEGTFEIY